MNDTTALPIFKRIGPFGLVVLLHLAFFYALQSGLLRKAAELLPKEVFVTFITPESKRVDPPKPPPQETPKVMNTVKKAVAPQAVTPAVHESPAEVSAAPQPPSPPAETIVQAAPSTSATSVTAPPAPQPKTVSSGVEYLQAPRPEYPPLSRRKGETGTVVVRVLINEAGQPQNADIHNSSGSSRLDQAARQAVLQALFKPHIENGKPVFVYVLVPINFQLNN